MRKRIHNRVCSCTPAKGLVQLETRILVEMVNRGVRRIKCMADLRRKANRGLCLGEICINCGHPWWAIKVLRYVMELVESYDYDEWLYANWNDRWYNLDAMTAEEECHELGRLADEAWRRLGHPEYAECERYAGYVYDWLYYDKYSWDRNEPDPEDEKPDTCIAVFNEGLPYWKPLFTQSIYEQ